MFSSLTTKLALKKAGLPSDILDFSSGPAREPNKLRKKPPSNLDDQDGDNGTSWSGWMSVKSLPLSVQPWLSPTPPPVDVSRVPGIGDKAPLDPQKRIVFAGGRRVLLVFLRCVGCAFAQKTFLSLRTLANRHGEALTCIAVSHSSEQATKKWVDMLGGAWSVRVVIDEDRALYAAWGLGLGSMWYLFNPTTQMQGWKEKGWLGDEVAGAIQRTGIKEKPSSSTGGPDGEDGGDGPTTVMGNKWQEAGAFAVDGTGTVIWGGKALRADDVMDLDYGARILMA
ncbi:hypothetical protein EDB81DRAFT_755788 [Dactylonectria macrodidyma]|uniref:Alkyl hydroperoxide reductase subunit C/ Thiol specific antioxidant domain-containing protein n=1 Tax=Dactylonectria macrodidyma TaxID=307937 RepID=A0A9P9JC83_9HYPO|nr:hypothetical protein EDB81DRAFT_755788 [Dactylonectria macrodidyma]